MSTESAPKRRVTVARPRAAIDKINKVLSAHDAEAVLGKEGIRDLTRAVELIAKWLPTLERHEAAKAAAQTAAKAAAEKRLPSESEMKDMSVVALKELAASKSVDVKGNKSSIVAQLVAAFSPVEKKEPAVVSETKAPKKAAKTAA